MNDPEYARVEEVRDGTKLIADGGFTCMNEGEQVMVALDNGGLFVPCREGRHYLAGQRDTADQYIGLRLATGVAV